MFVFCSVVILQIVVTVIVQTIATNWGIRLQKCDPGSAGAVSVDKISRVRRPIHSNLPTSEPRATGVRPDVVARN